MNKKDRRLINEQIQKHLDSSDSFHKKFVQTGDQMYRDLFLMEKGRAESLRDLLLWR